jgi:hypothetical protein
MISAAVVLTACHHSATMEHPDAVADGAAIDTAPTQRVVFVSSSLYSGNLGGFAGADASCQQLAIAAGLDGTFKAWLSDATTLARDRMTHSTLPYALVTGTVVAQDWTGLTSGTLLHPINRNEAGGLPPTGSISCAPFVWTGTWADGTHVLNDCSSWTSSAMSGGGDGGSWTASDGSWSYWGCVDTQRLCAGTAALYCVQQ